VASLNSIRVTKSWIAKMKKDISTTIHANIRIAIWMKFSKKETKPIRSAIDARMGRPASSPTSAIRPGWRSSPALMLFPVATRPSPAKLSKTMRASAFQLEMM